MVDLHGGKQLGFFNQEAVVSESRGGSPPVASDGELSPAQDAGQEADPDVPCFTLLLLFLWSLWGCCHAAGVVVAAWLPSCGWGCVSALLLGCCGGCCALAAPVRAAPQSCCEAGGPGALSRRPVPGVTWGLLLCPPVGLGSRQDCELGVRLPGPHWPGVHTHVPTGTDRKGDRAGSPQAPPGSPL